MDNFIFYDADIIKFTDVFYAWELLPEDINLVHLIRLVYNFKHTHRPHKVSWKNSADWKWTHCYEIDPNDIPF